MRAVNLLPREHQTRRSFRDEDPAVVIGSGLAAVILIVLGVSFMTARSHANAQQHKLAAARLELGRLSAQQQPKKATSKPKSTKPQRPIVAVPAVTAEEQPRLDALATALSGRVAWDNVLRDFSLVVPSDITVSSLSMSAPDPTQAGAGAGAQPQQSFQLGGLAYSHDSVARLLARLMLMPDLDNVQLTSSTANPQSGQVTFSITAFVKTSPLPAGSTLPDTSSAAPDTTTTATDSTS